MEKYEPLECELQKTLFKKYKIIFDKYKYMIGLYIKSQEREKRAFKKLKMGVV